MAAHVNPSRDGGGGDGAIGSLSLCRDVAAGLGSWEVGLSLSPCHRVPRAPSAPWLPQEPFEPCSKRLAETFLADAVVSHACFCIMQSPPLALTTPPAPPPTSAGMSSSAQALGTHIVSLVNREIPTQALQMRAEGEPGNRAGHGRPQGLSPLSLSLFELSDEFSG